MALPGSIAFVPQSFSNESSQWANSQTISTNVSKGQYSASFNSYGGPYNEKPTIAPSNFDEARAEPTNYRSTDNADTSERSCASPRRRVQHVRPIDVNSSSYVNNIALKLQEQILGETGNDIRMPTLTPQQKAAKKAESSRPKGEPTAEELWDPETVPGMKCQMDVDREMDAQARALRMVDDYGYRHSPKANDAIHKNNLSLCMASMTPKERRELLAKKFAEEKYPIDESKVKKLYEIV